MNIARVFPETTIATPDDSSAYSCHGVGKQHRCAVPTLFTRDFDEVHISVTFTWHREHADWLAEQWKHVAPVKIGGPGYSNDPGSTFVPGMYMKHGYTITSRGCPNRCWFCSVWKRNPQLIELPITDGHIIQDDNLLACSDRHIKNVFKMLSRQSKQAHFPGGLEAALLREWHVDLLLKSRIGSLWFAYDEPSDLEPLIHARRLFNAVKFNRNKLYCYVLIGYPKDTMEAAADRLYRVWCEGFMPYAMLWRNTHGDRDTDWIHFNSPWNNPNTTSAMCIKRDYKEMRSHAAKKTLYFFSKMFTKK